MPENYRDGALYIRVSTDKQEELSPDAQKRLLLDYAKKNKILVNPDYIFIENGISGRKAQKRPEFQKMISLAKSTPSPFQVILVWKFSRFARNQEESIVYKSCLLYTSFQRFFFRNQFLIYPFSINFNLTDNLHKLTSALQYV